MTLPSLPAASVTLTFKVPLLVRVRARLQLVLPTLALALAQVLPPSSETLTTSPLSRLALRVPLMVWAAVLVTKSVLLTPVSVPSTALATVVVGATVSKVALRFTLAGLTLPALSVRVALKALPPSLPHWPLAMATST